MVRGAECGGWGAGFGFKVRRGVQNPRTPHPAPRTSMRLTAVANDPAGFDVEGDLSEREPGLIAEAGHESEEPLDVAGVAHDAQRGANRAGTLAAAMLHELDEPRQVHVAGPCGIAHVVFGQPLSQLACARIAETAGPHGE